MATSKEQKVVGRNARYSKRHEGLGRCYFETALGGADHMGRADIAKYLISKGAHMDIFVATMLSKLDTFDWCFMRQRISIGRSGLSESKRIN